MTRPSVYVTRRIPLQVIEKLRERCDVEYNEEDRILSKQEFLEKVKNRDAILVVTSTMDEDVCKAAGPRCKIFANYGVGYNNIDINAATRQGILVSNAPDVVTDATADMTWALLLSAARRIVECDTFVRSGNKQWAPMNLLGAQVSGKTLGIIGSGRIGLAVAQRALGFKMKILYTDIKASPNFEAATGGEYADKDSLLRNSDFVSLHVPLLPSTRYLIGEEELRLMKRTAILVNASRGPVVNEKALTEALKNGEIAGAGLDVFENEPEVESGLKKLTNVVLAPHVGTSTIDTRLAIGELCIKNIVAALDGNEPPTCLNPEAKKMDKG